MNALRTTTALLALVLASQLIRTSEARAPTPPPCGLHAASALASDPDPLDCPFCGGNPQVHLKAFWALQKAIVRACHAAWL